MDWNLRSNFFTVRLMHCWFFCHSLHLAISAMPHFAIAAPFSAVEPRDAWTAVDNALPRDAAGDQWRTFLLLNELRSQSDVPEQADAEVVAKILKRFRHPHDFLRQEPYLTARLMLADWLTELDAAAPDRGSALAEAAANEFSPPSSAELVAATQDMERAYAELTQFLAAHSEVQAGWEDYFALPRWRQQLDRRNEMDPEILARVAARLESAASMFPHPTCARAGDSVREASRLIYRLNTSPDEAKARLLQLAKFLHLRPEELTSEDRELLSEVNAWLQRRDLGIRLTSAVLHLHSQPNFRAAISRRVLSQSIEGPIENTEGFADVLGGTTYRGTATTQGGVTLRLLPNKRQIAMQLDCALTIRSTSTGSPGGVTVQSGSTTSVTGVKRIAFDAAGLHLSPAVADAATNTQIYDVQAGRIIGRRAVASRVQQGAGEMEQEVARLSERRLERQLDQEAERQLLPLMRRWQNDLRRPLVLTDGLPQQMRAWSTEDFAYIVLTQAGIKQLAAPNKAPTVMEPSDVMLQVHDSFVRNLGDSLLAGHTFGEPELQTLVESLFGSAPESLRTADPDHPWKITFRKNRPLEVSIRDNELTLDISATGFKVGENEYPGMNIRARYQLASQGPGLRATRLDRLEIIAPDLQPGEQLGARQQAFRTMLRKRFDPILPETWEASVFRLASLSQDRSEVRVRKVVADDGWLTLSGELTRTASIPAAR